MKNEAQFIIDSINHNDLTDEEAEILKSAVHDIQELRRKKFESTLDNAAKIVASWPEWKRNILG